MTTKTTEAAIKLAEKLSYSPRMIGDFDQWAHEIQREMDKIKQDILSVAATPLSTLPTKVTRAKDIYHYETDSIFNRCLANSAAVEIYKIHHEEELLKFIKYTTKKN